MVADGDRGHAGAISRTIPALHDQIDGNIPRCPCPRACRVGMADARPITSTRTSPASALRDRPRESPAAVRPDGMAALVFIMTAFELTVASTD